MKWSKEIEQRVLATILGRFPTGKVGTCPLCGTGQWTLAQGFTLISLSSAAGQAVLGGSGLPCVAIVCVHCGNTHLLNIKVLGLEDLLVPESNTESKPEETEPDKPEMKAPSPPLGLPGYNPPK